MVVWINVGNMKKNHSLRALRALFFLLLGILCMKHGRGTKFDAYRLLQVEKSKVSYGSKAVAMNFVAAPLGEIVPSNPPLPGDLARKVVVVTLGDVVGEEGESVANAVADAIKIRQAAGLLLVLPTDLHQYAAAELAAWQELEQALISIPDLHVPVYFVFENDGIAAMSADLKEMGPQVQSAFSQEDRYQLTVKGSEPQPISSLEVSNIMGWLGGEAPEGAEEEQPLRTIAVVSYYDTLGASPDLSSGFNTNGSGMVSVLALARMFSKLYEVKSASFNVIFLLSGAGMLNYSGTKDWLSKADPAIIDSLDFVLCLDSLAGNGGAVNDKLYLHSSKPIKDGFAKEVFDAFTSAAASLGISVESVHKKINISTPDLQWQHEQFSMKRLFGATITTNNSPNDRSLMMGSIFDQPDSAGKKMDTLEQNLKVIATALGGLLYGEENPVPKGITEEGLFPSQAVREWSSTLAATPRPTTTIGENTEFLDSLQEVLGNYTTDVGRQSFSTTPPHVFYGSTKQTMTLFRVKPVVFDLLLSLILFVYLSVLYIIVKGPSNLEAPHFLKNKKN